MVDNKLIIDQFHEIQRILNHCKLKKLNMDEDVIVSAIIEKLPPSWKDYKKSLKTQNGGHVTRGIRDSSQN